MFCISLSVACVVFSSIVLQISQNEDQSRKSDLPLFSFFLLFSSFLTGFSVFLAWPCSFVVNSLLSDSFCCLNCVWLRFTLFLDNPRWIRNQIAMNSVIQKHKKFFGLSTYLERLDNPGAEV